MEKIMYKVDETLYVPDYFEHKFLGFDSKYVLPRFPNKSVDLILTDPPYDLSEELKLWFHTEFLRISRRGVIVFSPPENQWILPADQYMFWIKPTSTKNTSKRYSRFVEMIFLYGDLQWNTGRHWSQYTNVCFDLVDDIKLHPNRKPPSLIERLLHNHSNVGDIILDPFSGSHTVFDVAKALGRHPIAIEQKTS